MRPERKSFLALLAFSLFFLFASPVFAGTADDLVAAGDALLEAQDTAGAYQKYRDALALEPEHPGANFGLALLELPHNLLLPGNEPLNNFLADPFGITLAGTLYDLVINKAEGEYEPPLASGFQDIISGHVLPYLDQALVHVGALRAAGFERELDTAALGLELEEPVSGKWGSAETRALDAALNLLKAAFNFACAYDLDIPWADIDDDEKDIGDYLADHENLLTLRAGVGQGHMDAALAGFRGFFDAALAAWDTIEARDGLDEFFIPPFPGQEEDPWFHAYRPDFRAALGDVAAFFDDDGGELDLNRYRISLFGELSGPPPPPMTLNLSKLFTAPVTRDNLEGLDFDEEGEPVFGPGFDFTLNGILPGMDEGLLGLLTAPDHIEFFDPYRNFEIIDGNTIRVNWVFDGPPDVLDEVESFRLYRGDSPYVGEGNGVLAWQGAPDAIRDGEDNDGRPVFALLDGDAPAQVNYYRIYTDYEGGVTSRGDSLPAYRRVHVNRAYDGSAGPEEGTAEAPFRWLGLGRQALCEGGELLIAGGVYRLRNDDSLREDRLIFNVSRALVSGSRDPNDWERSDIDLFPTVIDADGAPNGISAWPPYWDPGKGLEALTLENLVVRGALASAIQVSHGRNIEIRRCLLHDNARWGWAPAFEALASESILIDHCTVAGNHAGGLFFGNPTDARVENSIIANNQGPGVSCLPPDTPQLLLSHSNLWGNNPDYDGLAEQTGERGNISVDPFFADPAAGDYRLGYGSPCIGAASDGGEMGALGIAAPGLHGWGDWWRFIEEDWRNVPGTGLFEDYNDDGELNVFKFFRRVGPDTAWEGDEVFAADLSGEWDMHSLFLELDGEGGRDPGVYRARVTLDAEGSFEIEVAGEPETWSGRLHVSPDGLVAMEGDGWEVHSFGVFSPEKSRIFLGLTTWPGQGRIPEFSVLTRRDRDDITLADFAGQYGGSRVKLAVLEGDSEAGYEEIEISAAGAILVEGHGEVATLELDDASGLFSIPGQDEDLFGVLGGDLLVVASRDDDEANLSLYLRRAEGFAQADLAGTWVAVGMAAEGGWFHLALVIDADGNFTGTSMPGLPWQGTVGGHLALDASGNVTGANGLAGRLNEARDLVAFGVGEFPRLAAMVRSEAAFRPPETFVVTVGQDIVFTDFNYHDTWFDEDPGNPGAAEIGDRNAFASGNAAGVSLSAAPGQAGTAGAEVGLEFTWDLAGYTWAEAVNLPVMVTVDYSWEIAADWAEHQGSANASVLNEHIGFENGTTGRRDGSGSAIWLATVGYLDAAGRRVSLDAYCQAHLVDHGGGRHSSMAEVVIHRITFSFPASLIPGWGDWWDGYEVFDWEARDDTGPFGVHAGAGDGVPNIFKFLRGVDPTVALVTAGERTAADLAGTWDVHGIGADDDDGQVDAWVYRALVTVDEQGDFLLTADGLTRSGRLHIDPDGLVAVEGPGHSFGFLDPGGNNLFLGRDLFEADGDGLSRHFMMFTRRTRSDVTASDFAGHHSVHSIILPLAVDTEGGAIFSEAFFDEEGFYEFEEDGEIIRAQFLVEDPPVGLFRDLVHEEPEPGDDELLLGVLGDDLAVFVSRWFFNDVPRSSQVGMVVRKGGEFRAGDLAGRWVMAGFSNAGEWIYAFADIEENGAARLQLNPGTPGSQVLETQLLLSPDGFITDGEDRVGWLTRSGDLAVLNGGFSADPFEPAPYFDLWVMARTAAGATPAALEVSGIEPASASRVRPAAVVIHGENFRPGAAAWLIGDGIALKGAGTVVENGTELSTTFDLPALGAAGEGVHGVLVVNPGGEEAFLGAAFEVAGFPALLSLHLSGPATVIPGAANIAFRVSYTNESAGPVEGVSLDVDFPAELGGPQGPVALGALAAGATGSRTFMVGVDAGAEIGKRLPVVARIKSGGVVRDTQAFSTRVTGLYDFSVEITSSPPVAGIAVRYRCLISLAGHRAGNPLPGEAREQLLAMAGAFLVADFDPAFGALHAGPEPFGTVEDKRLTLTGAQVVELLESAAHGGAAWIAWMVPGGTPGGTGIASGVRVNPPPGLIDPNPGNNAAEVEGNVLAAVDPNAIYADPPGSEEEPPGTGFVRPGQVILYTIEFENEAIPESEEEGQPPVGPPTARVRTEITLDPALSYDPETENLVPEFYDEQNLDLLALWDAWAGTDWSALYDPADLEISFSPVTGRVTWKFNSVYIPGRPFGGGEGDGGGGNVFLRTRVRPEAESGTVILMEAVNYFVGEDEGVVGSWATEPRARHIVDGTRPASAVEAAVVDGKFRVDWSASDTISGLRRVRIYGPDGEGGIARLAEIKLAGELATSGTVDFDHFVPEPGRTYEFSSLATDRAGNTQKAPATAQALSGIMGDLDGDGRVTLADAVIALRIALGLDAPTSAQVTLGDFGATGSISFEDAAEILRRAADIPAVE